MERRQTPRIPLDAPCLLTLEANYTETLSAMAIDVSQGGVQLALSPGATDTPLEVGLPVTLRNVPEPLTHLLDGTHGKVAWIGVRCCGIKLNRPLPLDIADATDLARL